MLYCKMINTPRQYINDTIAINVMSKEEGNLIKTRMISIGSRIELWHLIFLKLFLLSPAYMLSTGLSRSQALFYLIFKASL